VNWYYVAQCRIVAITVMCVLNCVKGDEILIMPVSSLIRAMLRGLVYGNVILSY
jgi:hypothetical protein